MSVLEEQENKTISRGLVAIGNLAAELHTEEVKELSQCNENSGDDKRSIEKAMLKPDMIASEKRMYNIVKRIQDIVLSTIALIVLTPLMLVVALIVWLDNPGFSRAHCPIYVQTRVGKNGRKFRFYKFRSMIPNAEKMLNEVMHLNEVSGPVFKIKDDPRITRFGRFIRKSSIDELPQLINIIKGDMSIVGPRPPLPREVEQYNEYERQRLYVKPGLTCYWQIVPHRNSVAFDEWVQLDLKYVQKRSFVEDWGIIFSTIRVVLGGHGE